MLNREHLALSSGSQKASLSGAWLLFLNPKEPETHVETQKVSLMYQLRAGLWTQAG